MMPCGGDHNSHGCCDCATVIQCVKSSDKDRMLATIPRKIILIYQVILGCGFEYFLLCVTSEKTVVYGGICKSLSEANL